MDLLGSFIIAFSMYSRIPMPQVRWTEKRMRHAMCFFPFVGIAVGVAFCAAKFFLVSAGMGLYGALILPAVPLLVTGGIHMDGFLDVADAVGSRADRDRKLEILKDPHAGAFAVMACVVYLLIFAAAAGGMSLNMSYSAAAVFVLSRSLSSLALVWFPKAKKEGLAAVFSGSAGKNAVISVSLIFAGVSLLWIGVFGGGWAFVFCFLSALAVFLHYRRKAVREFGGITGDLAGYFLQVCELALLLVLAALSGLDGTP